MQSFKGSDLKASAQVSKVTRDGAVVYELPKDGLASRPDRPIFLRKVELWAKRDPGHEWIVTAHGAQFKRLRAKVWANITLRLKDELGGGFAGVMQKEAARKSRVKAMRKLRKRLAKLQSAKRNAYSSGLGTYSNSPMFYTSK